MINAEQFVEDTIRELQAFKEDWNKCHQENSEDYPKEMDIADWDEQFMIWPGRESVE